MCVLLCRARGAAHKLREIGVSITGCPWQGPPARSPPLCQHDYRYQVAKIERLLLASKVSRCADWFLCSLMCVNPCAHAFLCKYFINCRALVSDSFVFSETCANWWHTLQIPYEIHCVYVIWSLAILYNISLSIPVFFLGVTPFVFGTFRFAILAPDNLIFCIERILYIYFFFYYVTNSFAIFLNLLIFLWWKNYQSFISSHDTDNFHSENTSYGRSLQRAGLLTAKGVCWC